MAAIKQQAGTVQTGARLASLKALAVAAVLVAIASAAILIGSLVAGSLAGSVSSVAGPVDNSYDQIESMRGLRGLPFDGSLDQIEQLRGAWTGR